MPRLSALGALLVLFLSSPAAAEENGGEASTPRHWELVLTSTQLCGRGSQYRW